MFRHMSAFLAHSHGLRRSNGGARNHGAGDPPASLHHVPPLSISKRAGAMHLIRNPASADTSSASCDDDFPNRWEKIDFYNAVDRLAILVATLHDQLFAFDSDGNRIALPKRLAQASDAALRPRLDEACLPRCADGTLLSTIRSVITTGRPQWIEYARADRSGQRFFAACVLPLPNDLRALPCVLWVVDDITERKRTEFELRTKVAQYKGFIDHSPSAMALKDETGRYVLVNRTFEEWLQRSSHQLVGRTTFDLFPEETAQRAIELDHRASCSPDPVLAENKIAFPDGTERQTISMKFPVQLYDGSASCIGTLMTDVTDQRRTEEELRHAQRIEAIGELAGGVAHDFNNLLTVIMFSLELISESAFDETAVRGHAAEALRATHLGADLTQRLLTFFRRQQPNPTVTDINRVVATVFDLAKRTLPENVTIETEFANEAWPVLVDRGQLESALLNLAVNARDAMPAGGRLRFETANCRIDAADIHTAADAAPGDYVAISVVDTGEGMTSEVMERALEPFFTTKGNGKGTGLGLSMVRDFAHQSGGWVRIHSEAEQGTTVQIFLPRTAAEVVEAGDPAAVVVPVGGQETILVVEDSSKVRRYLARALRGLGYTVLEAENGTSALRLLNGPTAVDLLVTDIVMPGSLNGRELALRALDTDPELRVLFTSGYSEIAAMPSRGIGADIPFLTKPFNREDLARKVRDVLGETQKAAA